eukprot:TRINITY_DN13651_c0_g1_i1.p1 TRINITY_DN13651_c0_g1~~TRINITY_DN13651_c0_g1_i1.p1  ORF type:complete len:315 (-),score=33.94 TRINITY_DN13651_c0_g1_i1:185-1099(-)
MTDRNGFSFEASKSTERLVAIRKYPYNLCDYTIKEEGDQEIRPVAAWLNKYHPKNFRECIDMLQKSGLIVYQNRDEIVEAQMRGLEMLFNKESNRDVRFETNFINFMKGTGHHMKEQFEKHGMYAIPGFVGKVLSNGAEDLLRNNRPGEFLCRCSSEKDRLAISFVEYNGVVSHYAGQQHNITFDAILGIIKQSCNDPWCPFKYVYPEDKPTSEMFQFTQNDGYVAEPERWNQDFKDVGPWLKSLKNKKLQKYEEAFIREGWEELSCVVEMKKDDLAICGIKRGHCELLYQEIQKLKRRMRGLF